MPRHRARKPGGGAAELAAYHQSLLNYYKRKLNIDKHYCTAQLALIQRQLEEQQQHHDGDHDGDHHIPPTTQKHRQRPFKPAPPSPMASLPTLPGELLDHITTYLHHAELRALRGTCRDIAAQVFHAFAAAHFAHCSLLLYNHDTIRTAIQVAEHPTFGPYLQKITCFVEEIVDHNDVPMREEWIAQRIPEHGTSYPEKEAAVLRKRAQIRRKCLEQLTFLFCRVRLNSSDTVTVELVDDDTADGRPHGVHKFPLTDHSRQYYEVPPAYDRWPFAVLLEALSLSGLPVSSLAVRGREWSLPVHLITSDPVLAARWEQVLRSVKTLILQLWVEVEGRNETHISKAVQTFVELIAAAPRLEWLNIWVQTDEQTRRPRTFAMHELSDAALTDALLTRRLTRVKHISLGGALVSMEALVKFISDQPQLQCIELGNIKFRKGSFPPRLLTSFHVQSVKSAEFNELMRHIVPKLRKQWGTIAKDMRKR